MSRHVSLLETLLWAYLAALLVALYSLAAARYESDEAVVEPFDPQAPYRLEYEREERERVARLTDPLGGAFDADGRWNVLRGFDHAAHYRWQLEEVKRLNKIREEGGAHD